MMAVKLPRSKTSGLAAAALCLLVPLTASAARELVQDGNVSVYAEEQAGCGPTAEVTVRADSPDVFQADSPRMQRLVDVVQAVLRYECPALDSVHVTGLLVGIDEPVYDGVANAVDDWIVQSHRSIGAEETTAGSSSGRETPGPAERVISVASVKLDMDVDTVRRNVSEVFGAEPRYDAQAGILQLDRPGCPADATPPAAGADYRRPAANCVTAWFTDRRLATLYRFRYTQSADGSLDAVRQVLVENFGEPRRDAWNDAGAYQSLLWTAPADAEAPAEALEARLFREGGTTVIDIVLADPRLAGGGATQGADRTESGGVELKL